MYTKYYSDKPELKGVGFDSVSELVDAEAKVNAEAEKKKKAAIEAEKKKKAEEKQREADRDLIIKSYNEVDQKLREAEEAWEIAVKLKNDYLKKNGSISFKYGADDHVKTVNETVGHTELFGWWF